MNITTTKAAADMYAALTKELDLESRTISFHIINDDAIAGGMIFDADDLANRSDAWLDLAEACSLDQCVSCDVVTYTLGRGETWDASPSDVVALDRFRQADPAAWDAMLWEFAEEINSINNLSAENPFYDNETEDE